MRSPSATPSISTLAGRGGRWCRFPFLDWTAGGERRENVDAAGGDPRARGEAGRGLPDRGRRAGVFVLRPETAAGGGGRQQGRRPQRRAGGGGGNPARGGPGPSLGPYLATPVRPPVDG